VKWGCQPNRETGAIGTGHKLSGFGGHGVCSPRVSMSSIGSFVAPYETRGATKR